MQRRRLGVEKGIRTMRCARCGSMKPEYAFNYRASSPEGKQSYCKECQAAYNRERIFMKGLA